jgi:hypothetical protein
MAQGRGLGFMGSMAILCLLLTAATLGAAVWYHGRSGLQAHEATPILIGLGAIFGLATLAFAIAKLLQRDPTAATGSDTDYY